MASHTSQDSAPSQAPQHSPGGCNSFLALSWTLLHVIFVTINTLPGCSAVPTAEEGRGLRPVSTQAPHVRSSAVCIWAGIIPLEAP